MHSAPVLSRVPTLTPEAALAASGSVVVDLRSPAEFADDHMPGAVNVSLFDDVERALIGTLYSRKSPDAAFTRARHIAHGRIEGLVEEVARVTGWEPPGGDLADRLLEATAEGIAALEEDLYPAPARELPPRPVVFTCWRGGLRSRSVVGFLRALGLDGAFALEGGYKGYRRSVLDLLDRWKAPPAYVLRGWTGVGKTLVLRELERLRPGWVVDLERCAGHRSSILGMVGMQPCTQRGFDSHLAERLRRGFDGPVVFEGESRKVGDSILPLRLWRALDGGANVRLTAHLERRVDVLIEDYLGEPGNREELRRQLPFIEGRLGRRSWTGVLVGMLDGGEERELVRVLLERYYDPLYQHSERERTYAVTLDSSDPARAARDVADWIEARGDAAQGA